MNTMLCCAGESDEPDGSLSLALNDGTTMPQIAFGLYLIPKDEAGACVQAAVDAGYRHFDGAAFYDNILFSVGDAPVDDEPIMPEEPSSDDVVVCTGVTSRGDVLRARQEAATIISID